MLDLGLRAIARRPAFCRRFYVVEATGVANQKHSCNEFDAETAR
jgi:hypothetical protein